MAKTKTENRLLDEIKVLNALEQNSKESVDEITKKCGFSHQKVWRIIKDLEKKKIIWGYTAVTDEKAKNLKHFIATLKRAHIPFDVAILKEIISDKLDNHPSGLVKIENIYFTHGIADMIFTFYAPDMVHAKKFVEYTVQRFNKYVQDYTITETLFPIRKQGFKNPQIKDLTEYL
jgi:DNA-binding Lrp family transcriptional regulator